MKKTLILTLALSLFSGIANAQNVGFAASDIYADNVLLTTSTPGLTILSATMSTSTLSGLSFTINDPATFLSEIQNLEFTSTLDSWQPVSALDPSSPFTVFGDWFSQRNNLTIGSTPVLLITTSPLATLSITDYVGFVSTSSVVPAGGGINVTFTGAFGSAVWDGFILGTEGSINLQAIPEPTTYALLFGIFGLGMVLWRRRR